MQVGNLVVPPQVLQAAEQLLGGKVLKTGDLGVHGIDDGVGTGAPAVPLFVVEAIHLAHGLGIVDPDAARLVRRIPLVAVHAQVPEPVQSMSK